MNVRNKLVGLSQPSLMFVGKAGAHLRVEHLKSDSVGYALALLTNIRLGFRRFARDKHSNFFALISFVNYEENSFVTLAPSGNNTKLFSL